MQGRNPILASVEFLLMQCKVHYRSVITNTKQLHIMQYYALRSRDFFPLHTDYIVGRFHCIVNADFFWLQVNAFQCTGLPLLVMSTHHLSAKMSLNVPTYRDRPQARYIPAPSHLS